MQILVVDDKVNIHESIISLLQQYNVDVDVAINGLDGYEKAIVADYDLYIIDHLMPIMDGLQLVKSLKSRPNTADAPILFMTTKQLSYVEKLAEFPLFSAVIHKPIVPESFYQVINQLLPQNTVRQSL
ncbi:response regulator [Thalassotalea piscium]|uniref:CheY-like chemotaxis protein n=1 Tax=Thalassotalea piscium TaxID=1230533 RepID=A0A7X0NJA9_9GAMM|nr:response regulator [Thalassotalea piscium]MBB6544474.1 CheY-like chemotaxis protein [Thalassotalea piscium]